MKRLLSSKTMVVQRMRLVQRHVVPPRSMHDGLHVRWTR